ncbi:decaprenyl-phosphate phosphoribosyltransferase [Halopolyspora algeriensis]|uniref:Decaprenyl-phosphate phosphoribosyltransferase n=1 Tax=Halopolyspora algeriensis TaxID=1500506 RepID=A0A368W3S5_9ACTN|nr:decaprenyl-phosphate phosphoribosyltransferase [Halopolyspora algeriensis]RCW47333.1 decaprenyl-phosphate phosphoribosyltransferase [Halopolyspora algeriensis]TQM42568.1 decaprenyl-phosphate phosphoribosyltransferase [Halopolyspora algeriensis]
MADKYETGEGERTRPDTDGAPGADRVTVTKADDATGRTEPEDEGIIAGEEDPSTPGISAAAADARAGTTGGLLKGLVREARPKQWVKNVLVLAAVFTAGQIGNPGVLLDSALAFVVFSMAASGVYFVNDAKDVESDRAHPTKCKRPIAAGLVPLPVAYAVAAVLLLGSIVVSALVSTPLAVVMFVYVAVQLGYCFGLKHQPVIDMCIVSSGFLLRAVAGGAAAQLYISQWFLLVTAFGSLFMVAGKRYAEIILAQNTGAKIRKSLEAYSASYLRFVWAISAAIVIMTYSLWAFEIREAASSIWGTVSIVPMVIAILRYAIDVDKGGAGEPEEVVLKDKILIILGAALVCCLFLAFYL